MANCKLGAALVVGALLSACATPTVRYVEITSPQDIAAHREQWIDSFHLQRSRLQISNRNTAAAGAAVDVRFNVVNQATDATEHRIAVLRRDSLLQRTTLSITKRQDSDMIASIGVDVVDNRLALIQNVGGILKGMATVGVGATSTVREQPQQFAFEWKLNDGPAQGWHDVVNDPAVSDPRLPPSEQNWRRYGRSTTIAPGSRPEPLVFVDVGPLSQTAEPYPAQFFAGDLNGIYYAACRPVIVRYLHSTTTSTEWRGRISDPSHLEFVAFPRSGKVEFHTGCGVSVSSNKDPTSAPDALAAAAIAQALAVREALDD